jgi:cytochrome c2
VNKQSANQWGAALLVLIFVAFAIAILANTANTMPVMAKQQVSQGDPLKAPEAIQQYGCGTCHQIPGITGANGTVGPKLDDLSRRSLLAGQIPNTPDNLMIWIQHPQQVRPGSDMPEMGVSENDARNIAAYLYSLP